MLIVMEDWNIHERLQLLFNIEAVWCFDIFEIDSAEGWPEQFDAVDEFFRILRVHANVNRFNSSELVEKYSFDPSENIVIPRRILTVIACKMLQKKGPRRGPKTCMVAVPTA